MPSYEQGSDQADLYKRQETASEGSSLRNRLADFTPQESPTGICVNCRSELLAGKEMCEVCGAPVAERSEQSDIRVATAAPTLTANQQRYDPYATFTPTLDPVADERNAQRPRFHQRTHQEDTERLFEYPPRVERQEEDEESERARLKRLRLILASAFLAVAALTLVLGWKSRNQAEGLLAGISHRLSSEWAGFMGTSRQKDESKQVPAANERSSARPRAEHSSQKTRASAAEVTRVRTVFEVREGSGPLVITDDHGNTSRMGPVLMKATASPMRIAISPRESLAMLLHRVPPVYPQQAREARIQGAVALRVVIGKDGGVTSADVVSGNELLVPSAVDAVRQWRYRPYFRDGQAQEVETTVVIEFSLVREAQK